MCYRSCNIRLVSHDRHHGRRARHRNSRSGFVSKKCLTKVLVLVNCMKHESPTVRNNFSDHSIYIMELFLSSICTETNFIYSFKYCIGMSFLCLHTHTYLNSIYYFTLNLVNFYYFSVWFFQICLSGTQAGSKYFRLHYYFRLELIREFLFCCNYRKKIPSRHSQQVENLRRTPKRSVLKLFTTLLSLVTTDGSWKRTFNDLIGMDPTEIKCCSKLMFYIYVKHYICCAGTFLFLFTLFCLGGPLVRVYKYADVSYFSPQRLTDHSITAVNGDRIRRFEVRTFTFPRGKDKPFENLKKRCTKQIWK